MSTTHARATLARALSYQPVLVPAADPKCWDVMSRTAYGHWHHVRPTGCDCEAARHGRRCWAYVYVAAVERGIVGKEA